MAYDTIIVLPELLKGIWFIALNFIYEKAIEPQSYALKIITRCERRLF